jgi:hypothetical protein
MDLSSAAQLKLRVPGSKYPAKIAVKRAHTESFGPNQLGAPDVSAVASGAVDLVCPSPMKENEGFGGSWEGIAAVSFWWPRLRALPSPRD